MGGVADEGGAPEDSSPAPPGRPARTARTQRQVRVLVVLLALLLIGNGIRLQLSGHDKHKAPAVTPTSAATPSPTRTPAVQTSPSTATNPRSVLDGSPTARPSKDVLAERSRGIATVLARQSAALLHRDRSAFAATIDPAAAAFRRAKL